MAGYGFNPGNEYGTPVTILPAYDNDPDHVADRRKVLVRIKAKEKAGVRPCTADVLALHHDGMPMSEIAEKLVMTFSTVHAAVVASLLPPGKAARGGLS